MSPLFRSTPFPAMIALCAGGFATTALFVHYHIIDELDSVIIAAVQGMESPALTAFMKLLSWMGTGMPIVMLILGIMLFLYKVLGHRKELFLFAGAAVGSGLLNLTLKHGFRRPRPELYRLADAAGFSFPSGHSMAAFSLYGILAFLLWKHVTKHRGRILLISTSAFFILGIGLSRIYLGVHYPSDVIGGYWASGCWLAAAVWIHQRLNA